MKNTLRHLISKQNGISESFVNLLEKILKITKESEQIKLGQIFKILSGKGYAALLIILSFPFCTPLQIPGFSTPFGIILGFLGLRLAFGKRLWWPNWILEKSFSSISIEKLVTKTISVFKTLQKILYPRITILSTNHFFRRIHGLLIFVLAIILSLPLPIPMTNLLSALPILCIGLGLLEDDGLVILIGYFIALISFLLFLSLFLFGIHFLKH